MIAPRICSVPECASSVGAEAVDFCRSYGLKLDEWQAMVLERSLGIREDRKWAAFEVATNVARQNGKNEIALARELVGLFLLDEKLLIHSAHEFKTSTEHQRRLEDFIQNTPDFHSKVKGPNNRGYRHSHGEESIELKTGQRIRFMTRTKGGGRGHTGDLVVFDEAMILADAMLGALMPTLSARSVEGMPQIWYFFTAVDQMLQEHGIVAARLRERALAGGDPQLAYFEWSADFGPAGDDDPGRLEAAMLEDQGAWVQANPALGIRISAEHVANERRSMDARTFAVERLGVGDWPHTDGSLQPKIDPSAWDALADERSLLLDPVCLAFDVSPDRSRASICAAGYRSDGLLHVEVVDAHRGTGWVVERLAELAEAQKPSALLCDSVGPAASLVYALQKAGLDVQQTTTSEHVQACGMLYDAVMQHRLRHLGTPELAAAIRGGAVRPLGEAWAWSRKDSRVDITPLVAATIAAWGAAQAPKKREPEWAFA